MPALTQTQVAQFHNEGWLLVDDLFDPERDIAPVIREYEGVLDRLARELFAAGAIKSTYADLPFSERVINVYRDSGKVHAQYFDFSLPQSGVTLDTPYWAGPSVFAMLRNERLLDAVESIVGPEIYSNPVQHVRIKPPEHLTPKGPDGKVQLGHTPIHQDNGVVLPEADHTDILTVWFPLVDATIENGCLAVYPRSHKEGLFDHCPSNAGAMIPQKLMTGDPVSVPVKLGSALFLTKLTAHFSHSNHSEHVRFSFDLRYNPIGQPTGRAAFPGFVARSRANPASELRDAAVWDQLWHDARNALATQGMGRFNRWSAENPVCA
jgi:phytanoyl-CoA hydroxylase